MSDSEFRADPTAANDEYQKGVDVSTDTLITDEDLSQSDAGDYKPDMIVEGDDVREATSEPSGSDSDSDATAGSVDILLVEETYTVADDLDAAAIVDGMDQSPVGSLTARDIMSGIGQYADESEDLQSVAKKLRDWDVGSLPITRDEGKHLLGIITDRDIVVKCVAEGKNPAETKASAFILDETVTIGADDDLEELIQTMKNHQLRRLPVIDGDELVGIVSQADLARNLPYERVGELLEAISS